MQGSGNIGYKVPAKSKERAEILPGRLEPAYLLRLFFAYPPQDFTAYQQLIDKTGQPIAVIGGAAAMSDGAGAPGKAEAGEENPEAGAVAAYGAMVRETEERPGAAAPLPGKGQSLLLRLLKSVKRPAVKRQKTAGAPDKRREDTDNQGTEGRLAMTGGEEPAGGKAAAAALAVPAVTEERAARSRERPEHSNSETAAASRNREAQGEAAAPGLRSDAAAEPGGEPSGAVSLPLFSCRFNLLTTLEPEQLKRLQKLPFYNSIKKLLTFRTLFLGTTLSEFAPLPAPFPPGQAAAAAAYLRAQAKNYPLVIVKDMPQGHNALIAPPQAKAGQNFMAALEKCGFMAVEGQALAYVPVDYADIEAFLARFSKARRKDFRRKLRARQNIAIEVLQQGAATFADEEQIDLYYRLYQQVYAQSLVHFDLLSKDFFRALLQKADNSLRFITYRDKTGQLIGYNICFIVGDRLVDKYIGLDYPAATDNSLYFVSWFYNLAYAREQGLKYYVAGWTDPQVKAALGAKFIMTRHAVYIRNPLLRLILRCCRPLFEADAHISAAAPAAKAAAAVKAAGAAARKAGGSR